MTSVYWRMAWICFFSRIGTMGFITMQKHHAIWECHFKGTFSKHHGRPNLRWYSRWRVGTITMVTWISFRPCHRENYQAAQRKMALHLKSKVATFEDTTIYDWTMIIGGRVTWFAWIHAIPAKRRWTKVACLMFFCFRFSGSSSPSHELLCILVVLGGGGAK